MDLCFSLASLGVSWHVRISLLFHIVPGAFSFSTVVAVQPFFRLFPVYIVQILQMAQFW